MNGQPNGAVESLDKPTPFPAIDDEPENAPKSKKRADAPGHKRSISGNILSKFLRPNAENDKGAAEEKPRGAMAEVQKRKRKGSLRKTVLGKNRDRKGSDLKKSPLSSPATTPTTEEATPRPSIEAPVLPEVPHRWPFRTLSRVSIPSIRSSIASVDPASSNASITSPTMATDASTDEEDMLPQMPTLRRLSTTSTRTTSTRDSYFPIQTHKFTAAHTRSPLATAPQSVAGTPTDEEEWDYSETAFWGYVILIVTWIVFVVGMGSCFGVWSWAWDVGETPYAPPELEDDPTLPIVGYYPALLVLTCIMAWVWVIVAWVGMKYFRHADFKGDDG
jgi:hypothetical protein